MGEVRAIGARGARTRATTDEDARAATVDRRADRARALLHAAEVILLGHDDAETIRLEFDARAYTDCPGVRR